MRNSFSACTPRCTTTFSRFRSFTITTTFLTTAPRGCATCLTRRLQARWRAGGKVNRHISTFATRSGATTTARSEERRVGKECKTREEPDKKKKQRNNEYETVN